MLTRRLAERLSPAASSCSATGPHPLHLPAAPLLQAPMAPGRDWPALGSATSKRSAASSMLRQAERGVSRCWRRCVPRRSRRSRRWHGLRDCCRRCLRGTQSCSQPCRCGYTHTQTGKHPRSVDMQAFERPGSMSVERITVRSEGADSVLLWATKRLSATQVFFLSNLCLAHEKRKARRTQTLQFCVPHHCMCRGGPALSNTTCAWHLQARRYLGPEDATQASLHFAAQTSAAAAGGRGPAHGLPSLPPGLLVDGLPAAVLSRCQVRHPLMVCHPLWMLAALCTIPFRFPVFRHCPRPGAHSLPTWLLVDALPAGLLSPCEVRHCKDSEAVPGFEYSQLQLFLCRHTSKLLVAERCLTWDHAVALLVAVQLDSDCKLFPPCHLRGGRGPECSRRASFQ